MLRSLLRTCEKSRNVRIGYSPIFVSTSPCLGAEKAPAVLMSGVALISIPEWLGPFVWGSASTLSSMARMRRSGLVVTKPSTITE